MSLIGKKTNKFVASVLLHDDRARVLLGANDRGSDFRRLDLFRRT